MYIRILAIFIKTAWGLPIYPCNIYPSIYLSISLSIYPFLILANGLGRSARYFRYPLPFPSPSPPLSPPPATRHPPAVSSSSNSHWAVSPFRSVREGDSWSWNWMFKIGRPKLADKVQFSWRPTVLVELVIGGWKLELVSQMKLTLSAKIYLLKLVNQNWIAGIYPSKSVGMWINESKLVNQTKLTLSTKKLFV